MHEELKQVNHYAAMARELELYMIRVAIKRLGNIVLARRHSCRPALPRTPCRIPLAGRRRDFAEVMQNVAAFSSRGPTIPDVGSDRQTSPIGPYVETSGTAPIVGGYQVAPGRWYSNAEGTTPAKSREAEELVQHHKEQQAEPKPVKTLFDIIKSIMEESFNYGQACTEKYTSEIEQHFAARAAASKQVVTLKEAIDADDMVDNLNAQVMELMRVGDSLKEKSAALLARLRS